jgi:hypothetical protein
MSHSLHRYGTEENLSNDYTFYARASRWVNRDGCGPKLQEILKIVLSENPVNVGSSRAGKSTQAGLDLEEYAKSLLNDAYGVACCFSNTESLKKVMVKLKEADTGISIVNGGLIDEIVAMAKEIGIQPHTAFLSLGIHGKKALLPSEQILEMTTMCGHGMTSELLASAVKKKVDSGEMTPEEGAKQLAQPCPCGIFNTDRCAELLKK